MTTLYLQLTTTTTSQTSTTQPTFPIYTLYSPRPSRHTLDLGCVNTTKKQGGSREKATDLSLSLLRGDGGGGRPLSRKPARTQATR